MNKNRINLRQSRFSCLRSFVRFFLLALKGSPNSSSSSSRQLELEPSPGCSLLCLPPSPSSSLSFLLAVPPLCLSIVSIRNARVTGTARLPFSCFSPGDFTAPTAPCQRAREREIGTGTEVQGAMARVYCGTYCTQCWHFLLSCEAFDKSPKMHMANQLTVPERERNIERGRGTPLSEGPAHVTSTRISAGQEAGRALTAAISVCDSQKGRNKLQLSNATANATNGRTHLPGLVARMWAAAAPSPASSPASATASAAAAAVVVVTHVSAPLPTPPAT